MRRFNNTGGGQTPSSSGSWIPSIAGGALGLAANLISNRQQKKREQDRRLYDLEQWHRQNKYNHPLQQMQRLAQAGLNPNLIYGSSPGSAVGNAGAIPAGQAPEYNLDNPVTSFMDARVKQAQSDNLRSAVNLNTANAMKSISQSGLAKSQTNQINKLLSGNLEIQQEDIKQKKIGTFLKDLEKAAMTNKDKGFIARYAAETTKHIAEGNSAAAKVELDKLNEFFAKKGIRPNDPLFLRILGQIFGLNFKEPISEEKKQQIQTYLSQPLIYQIMGRYY